jgi:hypothetical protein
MAGLRRAAKTPIKIHGGWAFGKPALGGYVVTGPLRLSNIPSDFYYEDPAGLRTRSGPRAGRVRAPKCISGPARRRSKGATRIAFGNSSRPGFSLQVAQQDPLTLRLCATVARHSMAVRSGFRRAERRARGPPLSRSIPHRGWGFGLSAEGRDSNPRGT